MSTRMTYREACRQGIRDAIQIDLDLNAGFLGVTLDPRLSRRVDQRVRDLRPAV